MVSLCPKMELVSQVGLSLLLVMLLSLSQDLPTFYLSRYLIYLHFQGRQSYISSQSELNFISRVGEKSPPVKRPKIALLS